MYKKMLKGVSFFPILLFVVACPSSLLAHLEPFPVFDSIRPNVEFWIKVYTRYPLNKGIIHDSEDLRIIYEIIDLPASGGSIRKRDKRLIRATKAKYRTILSHLVTKRQRLSPEEKRVLELFDKQVARKRLKRAARKIRFQRGQSDRFMEGIRRSGAYLNEIKRILLSYGLPEDLAYLPHVESSFNYDAYSKFSAAGIWQFTRHTGRRFLHIGYEIDERRDPILATHAAAKLLKLNYEELGNWPLAITAYNHGTAGMKRARRKCGGDYEAIFSNYKGRIFGFASKNFYSEFLAARKVAKDYSSYFGKLKMEEPVRYKTIQLRSYIDIRDLTRYLEIGINTIRKLNPALRRPVYTSQKYIPKGYTLRLPENVQADIATLAENLPDSIKKSGQKRSRYHRVRNGDTAYWIAKRNGVSLERLAIANNLDSKARIYAGQTLRIPSEGEELKALAVAAKSTRMEEKAEETAKTELSAEISLAGINPDVLAGSLFVEEEISHQGRKVGIITVEAEETLGHYADWLGIPTQRIRRLNGFSSRRSIRISEKIKIPLTTISREEFEQRRLEYHKGIEEDFYSSYSVDGAKVYTLKRGESIWYLCYKKFDIPLWLLRKYNSGLDFNSLHPGQEVYIPIPEPLMSPSV